MADIALLIATWLVGASFTMAALSTMGEASDVTHGDCFSGDASLDAILIALWPIFWPCWAAYLLGRWIFGCTRDGDGLDG